MNELLREPLIAIPKLVFRNETVLIQVPNILGWIDRNLEEFHSLLNDFDVVVRDFNTQTEIDVNPDSQNFHMIKSIIGAQHLPTIQELLAEPGIVPLRYY